MPPSIPLSPSPAGQHASGGGAHREGRGGLRRGPEAAHALPTRCASPYLLPFPPLFPIQAGTLVVAEHTGRGAGGSAAALKPPTLSAVAAARKLGGPVAVLVAGSGEAVADVAAAVAKIEGVDEVITTESPALDHALPEPLAALLTNLAAQRSFSHVLAASSTFSRNVLPRVAALLDAAMVSDVVEIVDETTFVRPIYAGNALATVRCSTPSPAVPTLLTVRATSFPASSSASSSESSTAPKTTPFDFQVRATSFPASSSSAASAPKTTPFDFQDTVRCLIPSASIPMPIPSLSRLPTTSFPASASLSSFFPSLSSRSSPPFFLPFSPYFPPSSPVLPPFFPLSSPLPPSIIPAPPADCFRCLKASRFSAINLLLPFSFPSLPLPAPLPAPLLAPFLPPFLPPSCPLLAPFLPPSCPLLPHVPSPRSRKFVLGRAGVAGS
ncbi:unnamed protein product [Closterium sp. Naga37s-1]|nr:unnamed protein product [Closterium sp. Naga37s-1]